MPPDGSRSLSTLLVALLLLTFPQACSRGSSPATGTLETNRTYWNALSGGMPPPYARDAMDVLKVEGATTFSRSEMLKIRACSQLWIDALEAEDERIAALQRQDVEAELLAYAGELASTHAAQIALLSELRRLVDNPPRARSLGEQLDALQTKSLASEVAVRAQLIERFGQEFAPRAAAPVPDPADAGPPSPKTIDAQRMKFDLIGREVSGWEFEALDEFVTFEVRQSRTDSQVAVFGVVARMRGARSGTTQEVSFSIGYKSEPHGWRVMRVSPY